MHPFNRPQNTPPPPGCASGRLGWRAWLGLIVAFGLLAGCGAPKLPPIIQAPTQQYSPGKVVWHDLLTPDLAAAKRFYGGLFGWTFKDRGDYSVALNGDVPIAGLAANPKKSDSKESAGWWLVYLSVPDVDKAAAVAGSAGGKVLKGPGDMVGRGRYAVVTDPQGAPLILLRAKDGDPSDGPPAVNGWLWNELWSSDPAASRVFYDKLADLDASPVPGKADKEYWVLGRDGKWRFGVTGLPFEDLRSQWVPCIRVADLAKVLAGVKANGGRILIRPDHALNNGTVAVVQDPWGALFMVGIWEPQAGGKEQAQ